MMFTLWQKSVLLGESPLDQRPGPNGMAGAFRPTPAGDDLLPAFFEETKATIAFYTKLDRVRTAKPGGEVAFMASLMETPEGQRMFAAAAAVRELELEVRDPEGRIVLMKHVGISDMVAFFPEEAVDAASMLEADGDSRYMMVVILATNPSSPHTP